MKRGTGWLRAATLLIGGVAWGLAWAGGVQDAPSPEERTRLKEAYERDLEAYTTAHGAFESEHDAYWARISSMRDARQAKRRRGEAVVEADYVTEHPPEYKGPKRPKIPAFMQPKPEPGKPAAAPPQPTPLVADFLSAAKAAYSFEPRAAEEKAYMLAFAREALAKGLTAEQVVGVYALETGGIGPYDRQSGVFTMSKDCKRIAAVGTPARSLALSYVQLLPANSALVSNLHSDAFEARLRTMASESTGARASELTFKGDVLKSMVGDMRAWIAADTGSKNNWREFVRFGRTEKGLAVHALLLDADLGPWLQVEKLLGIVRYATGKGVTNLDSSRLELINLVGDGRGVDALTPAATNAASANFFDPDGYAGNPVAKGVTASGLLTKLGDIIARQKTQCGSKMFFAAFDEAARQ